MLEAATRVPLLFAVGLLAFPLLAQEPTHPNLSGTWQMNPAKSELDAKKDAALTWKIDQNDKEIHITENEKTTGGKEKTIEFSCTTNGKDCDINGEGANSKVALWYNGPMLVAMEKLRNGEQVSKDQINLSADGKELSVVISSIIPPGEKPEKLVFEKQP